MPETPTIRELEAQVEADWERDRQAALTAEASRRLRAINAREQTRERERRNAERQRQEFAKECDLARKAHLALFGSNLADALDPAANYDLLRINNMPALAGAIAFSSSEKATAAHEHLRGSVLYVDPEGGARSIPGRFLGQYLEQGELLAVDPTPADLAALASKVQARKQDRQQRDAEILARERAEAEREHLRKKYGAPVS